MSDDATWDGGVRALQQRLTAGETTARAALDACLARVAAHDGQLGAFCRTFADRARARADEWDRRRAAGENLPPLCGVPVASKDNLLVAGEQVSAGSRMLAGFRAPFTATSLQRLEDRGAVLFGATNMDEFGMGSTTENSALQRTRNPFGADLVPGGSSGGSAVAVAAGLCPLAIGSDTGGSVRQPAALCGVTGLKPTYGRVSRYGLIAYASSLDCVGAIARTAEDLALWLDCASGADAADVTGLPDEPTGTLATLGARRDLAGLRLGVPEELNGDGIDDEVLRTTRAAADELQRLGAELVPCRLPATRHAVHAYYLIAACEAASNLARYDGVHYGSRAGVDGDGDGSAPHAGETCRAMTTRARTRGFGDEVQLRILLGTFASSVGYSDRFYHRALAARGAIRRDFARALGDCDLLLCPTSPTPAPRFGDAADDPLRRYLRDALTVPASLAGVPALSMPCGVAADGRPIGLQLMAAHRAEQLLLQVAHVFQQHTTHHLVRPPLAAPTVPRPDQP